MIDFLLRDIQLAHSQKDISKLEVLINQLLNVTAIPIVSIVKHVPLERLRNNYNGEVFYSEEEISFRRDHWNINEFGRANFPNSSKFYASLASKYISDIRVVNVFETNKEFRQNKRIKKRQVFTSGQWITNDTLNVAIFPFFRNAILYNEEIGFHSIKFSEIINEFNEEQKKIYKKALKFISYYFALKDIRSHYDYAVSAYISELLFDKYGIDGILYPTVRAEFKTYNLVLSPEASLSKLTLINSAMFELFMNGKKALVGNVAIAENVIDNNIYWSYLDRTSEAVLNKLL